MITGMRERSIEEIIALIKTLRGEGGCPWDRELTLGEVLSSIVEEAYELSWAHQLGQPDDVFDELGDVLFLTVFAATLFREEEPSASVGAIAARAFEKIKRRHPHVFEGKTAASREESITHWNRIKAEENASKQHPETALGDVMENLPPLRRAEQIQRLAAKVGFDWNDAGGIIDKLEEEVDETKEILQGAPRDKIRDEIGDLLFTVVNLARFLDIDTEHALSHANAKFIKRFTAMEHLIERDSRTLSEMSLEEMDTYWDRIKNNTT